MTEPTHKRVLCTNEMRDGTVVTVYFTPPFRADMSIGPDEMVFGSRRATDAEIRRGWVDLDEAPDV